MVLEDERLSGDDITIDYVVGDADDANGRQGNPLLKGAKATDKSKKPMKSSETAKNTSNGPHWEAQAWDVADGLGRILVLLDVRPDAELEEERLARELINRIQRARKKGNLVPEDAIQVVISTNSAALRRVLSTHVALIDATVKQPIACCSDSGNDAGALATAVAAVEARGEQLGDLATSDPTTVGLFS